MYVERLAERLGLTAPTISFHLKKLSDAGAVTAYKNQYYMMHSLQQALKQADCFCFGHVVSSQICIHIAFISRIVSSLMLSMCIFSTSPKREVVLSVGNTSSVADYQIEKEIYGGPFPQQRESFWKSHRHFPVLFQNFLHPYGHPQ